MCIYCFPGQQGMKKTSLPSKPITKIPENIHFLAKLTRILATSPKGKDAKSVASTKQITTWQSTNTS
jgi:hypothetical protein